MTKRADIGTKRLISLDPTAWVRWLLHDDDLRAIDLLTPDFQWVSRESDALVRVQSPLHGEFLVLNEIQLHPDPRIPQRICAYAALARERHDLEVYPVVVNILRPPGRQRLARRFRSRFRGLVARQDFQVINLWEVDVNLALQEPLLPLLPFAPILKGGNSEPIIAQAVVRLRADANLAQMENLLAFFASFVMSTELVQRIMRWDMAVLRESPWYTEIRQEGWQLGLEKGLEKGLEQGLEKGLEKGLEQGLKLGERRNMRETILRVLQHRFGPAPSDFEQQLQEMDLPELRGLLDAALDVASLDEFGARLLAHA